MKGQEVGIIGGFPVSASAQCGGFTSGKDLQAEKQQ